MTEKSFTVDTKPSNEQITKFNSNIKLRLPSFVYLVFIFVYLPSLAAAKAWPKPSDAASGSWGPARPLHTRPTHWPSTGPTRYTRPTTPLLSKLVPSLDSVFVDWYIGSLLHRARSGKVIKQVLIYRNKRGISKNYFAQIKKFL